jgi:hypothetical protein
MDQQLRIAAGFRDFADHVRAKFEELAERGTDYTVTEEDIRDMVASVRNKA